MHGVLAAFGTRAGIGPSVLSLAVLLTAVPGTCWESHQKRSTRTLVACPKVRVAGEAQGEDPRRLKNY